MSNSKIQKLEKRLEQHEERIRELEEEVNDSVSLDMELSMPEFVNNECKASTHQERVISIAYYLKAYEDQDSFTKNDLEEAYQRCGESSTNFSARAAEAVKEGFLKVEDNGRPRHWSLTKTGAEEVERLRSDVDE
jgi:ADP-ribose pyrophosphatase YjhB (NUDIX family)